MEPVTPLDWQRMFFGNEPPLFFLEIVIRVVLIYLFAVLVLRFMGKRGNLALTPFENVVIIALGSAVGDTMFYPEVPILYAWLVVAVVVLLDNVLATAQVRFRRVNTFVEGNPRLMIREGEVLEDSLKQTRLRRDEFFAMLREQEVTNTGEVRYAFLERSGQVGLFRYGEDEKKEGESTYPDKLA